jgi:hypothetical protein
MDIVDKTFWTSRIPWLEKLFALEGNHIKGLTPRQAAQAFVLSATEKQKTFFVNLPGINYTSWTPHEKEMRYRYRLGKKKDLLPFTILGTTLSGDSISTTLGNTFREILYINYYIYKETGKKFWQDNSFYTPTAGDDSLVLCTRTESNKIYEAILKNTSRTPDKQSSLG